MPSKKGKKGRRKKKRRKNKKRTNGKAESGQPQQRQQPDGAAAAASAAMMASAESACNTAPPPHENLRFAVGDIILANCNLWRRGRVVECNAVQYHQNSPPDRLPYRLLCGNDLMFAPEDSDYCIRPHNEETILTLDGPAEPSLMEREFPAATVRVVRLQDIWTKHARMCLSAFWCQYTIRLETLTPLNTG